MEYSKAVNSRDMLENELQEIYKLPTSIRIHLFYLPDLVDKEIQRLSDEIGKATERSNVRISEEGELMLSNIPSEFGFYSSEATENFLQKLKSEYESIKSVAPFPFTSDFIQKVIDHTESYLKKQRRHELAIFGPKENKKTEMEHHIAKLKKERLQSEVKLIETRARTVVSERQYLLKLMKTEIQRLSEDLENAIRNLKHYSDEIKIPVEGELMLANVPDKYGLTSSEETAKFIERLKDELEWVLSLDGQFPLTFQFIQRVIGHAERYMIEKRPFEVAVFGRSTDRRTG